MNWMIYMNKLFLILFIVAMVIVGPLLLIWSVNTLFSVGINYGAAEWLAALILGGTLQRNR
jgi:hypothetical protein